MMIAECQLCLQVKPLIAAHIIPECFYDIGSMSYMYSESAAFRERRPKGVYDEAILCGPCDNELGELDGYAKSVLLDRRGISSIDVYDPRSPVKRIYRLDNDLGYDKLNRFFISVLWRCSIAKYKDLSGVSLGAYETHARNTLIDPSFNYKIYFGSLVCILKNKPEGLANTIPKKVRHMGVNFYRMLIGSTSVMTRCDKRILANDFTLSASDILIIEDDYRQNPEYQWIYQVLNERQNTSKSRG